MDLKRSKIWLADIYERRIIDRGTRLDKQDVGHKNRFYKTIEHKIYNRAMVLEVANGNYIDLAELGGVADYLILSAAAKLNTGTLALMESCDSKKYQRGKKYVKILEPAYPQEETDVNYGDEEIDMKEVINDAVEIRSQCYSYHDELGL